MPRPLRALLILAALAAAPGVLRAEDGGPRLSLEVTGDRQGRQDAYGLGRMLEAGRLAPADAGRPRAFWEGDGAVGLSVQTGPFTFSGSWAQGGDDRAGFATGQGRGVTGAVTLDVAPGLTAGAGASVVDDGDSDAYVGGGWVTLAF